MRRLPGFSRFPLISAVGSSSLWAGDLPNQWNVRDSSGSAILGAEIKATPTATGFARTAVAGADGGYVLTNVPLGPYMLEISNEVFTKYVRLAS
jgi:hypothetical protein